MTDKEELVKRLEAWSKVKINLNLHGRQPNPKQGELWWGGLGENIGSELNGKSTTFARPILVYRKLSRYNFMGIPLTSKPHEGSWYVTFRHAGKDEVAVLAQARCMSVKRLYERIGKLDEADLIRIRDAFLRFYNIKI